MTNHSRDAVDLDGLVVDLVGTDGLSAEPLVGPPADPLRGTLSPGDRAAGTYVFTIDPGLRARARIRVSLSDEPVVVLRGTL